MDWLKDILQSLPLDTISDILGELIIWWSQLVKNVPPADLPMYAYIGGAVIVLVLWLLVARMIPRPFGGMSWMVLFAVLLAPGTALSDPSVIAPASISVVYAVMMKDTTAAVSNALPVLVVLVVGLFIGFVWQLIRGAFESSLDKARIRTAEDTQATMQLTTGNYLIANTLEEDSESLPATTIKRDTPKTVTSTVPTTEMTVTKNGATDTDISLKKDSESKRKPVEGFYNKKVIKEPVATESATENIAFKEPVTTTNKDIPDKK